MNKSNIIILIVLIVLSVLLIGWVVWYRQKAMQDLSQPAFQSPMAKHETADWQTYRNKEYGFEVKYPSGFERNTPQFTAAGFTVTITKKGFPGWYEIECKTFSPGDNKMTAKQFAEQLSNPNKIISEITFDNKPAFKVSADSSLGGRFTIVFIQKNDDIYTISYEGSDEAGLKYFNQILSTFKFISE